MDDWEVILTKWKELTTSPSAVKSLNIQNVGIDYKKGNENEISRR